MLVLVREPVLIAALPALSVNVEIFVPTLPNVIAPAVPPAVLIAKVLLEVSPDVAPVILTEPEVPESSGFVSIVTFADKLNAPEIVMEELSAKFTFAPSVVVAAVMSKSLNGVVPPIKPVREAVLLPALIINA